MTAKAISEWLAVRGEADTLVSRARRLILLEKLYANCVPEGLSRGSSVTNLREGILILRAQNGAIATKLRQIAPSLLDKLKAWNQDLIQIQVVVQAQGSAIPAKPPAKTGLATQGVHEFEALGNSLPDSELKTAVARLVARQKGQIR